MNPSVVMLAQEVPLKVNRCSVRYNPQAETDNKKGKRLDYTNSIFIAAAKACMSKDAKIIKPAPVESDSDDNSVMNVFE